MATFFTNFINEMGSITVCNLIDPVGNTNQRFGLIVTPG
jgi:hypothetical protein